MLGKHNVAWIVAEELVRLAPRHGMSFMACARSYAAAGKDAEALRACESALRVEARNPAVIAGYATVLAMVGRYKEALAEWDKALQADPGSCETLITEASLLACCPERKYRDGVKARALALKAFGSNKGLWDNPEAIMVLAAAHAECGEFKEAEKLAIQAINQIGQASPLKLHFLKEANVKRHG